MTEARVVTRDKYPLFTYKCSCGHWEDDHYFNHPNSPDYCGKCYDLAEVRLNATPEELETLAEPDDPEHPFVRGEGAWDKERVQWHVSVYERDRNYGGPEEGGWWYDSGTVVQTIPVTSEDWSDEDIELLIDLLRKQYADTSEYGISSVLYSGGEYEIYAEPQKGADWPQERPHYE